MSKKSSPLAAAFTKRKKQAGLMLGGAGGKGWGHSLLTPATWTKRRGKHKGSKLLQRAFGVFRRKGDQSRKLDAVWSKRVKAKPGTILAALGKQRGGRSRKPMPGNIMSIVEAASKRGTKPSRAPHSMMAALGAVGSHLLRDDRPTPAEVAAEVQAEAGQTVTTSNAQVEAQQSKALLSRVAEWIRERINRPGPAA